MAASTKGPPHTGVVAAFDEHAGLGTITTPEGDDIAFHCTQIADGSRQIDVGVAVEFEPLARLGRWEAGAIRPARGAA
jgi:cold shock CspA family protein